MGTGTSDRGLRKVTLVACVMFTTSALHCHSPGSMSPTVAHPQTRSQQVSPARVRELKRFAARDPLGFLEMCRRHYLDNVADYRCKFSVTERIRGVESAEQQMAISFREEPFSVDMRWLRNPGVARRVTYVAGRWHWNDREHAVVYPRGLLALLAPLGIKIDIHADHVRRAGRRTIDTFGFRHTLEHIIKYCQLAKGDPAYDLEFVGQGDINGRITLVFERYLPFTGEDGTYPDRVQVINIDCGWLLPTGCFAYADDAREQLLGRYITTEVELNVGVTDDDF